MESLEGRKTTGFYRYSMSGDLYGEETRWGLGNTVFAVKIMYTIGSLDTLSTERRNALAEFIRSFQKADGTIIDPLIARRSRLSNLRDAIRSRCLGNLRGAWTVRAETRQAMSSLRLLGERPRYAYTALPYSLRDLKRFLGTLEWRNPWSAGSHFSHLLFFYRMNGDVFGYMKDEGESMTEYAIDYVNHMQSEEDGAWSRDAGIPVQWKINGAMKILTGLKAAGRMSFQRPEKLVDLALAAVNDSQACDNFNIVYVLKYANEMTNGNYRTEEIREFCRNRLQLYKKYYHPHEKGFSFYEGRSNDRYYGARITKGMNESDIHGTCLFLWGLSILGQALGFSKTLGIREFDA